METLFKNIISYVKRSEVFEFELDPELIPDTARYFLVKGMFKDERDENGDLTGNKAYFGSVYSTGYGIKRKEMIKFPRRLDAWGFWVYSVNSNDFLNAEVIEILMDE